MPLDLLRCTEALLEPERLPTYSVIVSPRDITQIKHRTVENPYLHIVLFQPEIPANTGNIARLCAAAELPLHLIHPLGFRLDDKHLKRAGLDYWTEVDVRQHASFDAFIEENQNRGSIIGFSRHAAPLYTQAIVNYGDFLLFGPETRGLPSKIMDAFPCYRVPMWGQVRSLNLSTTVGIVAYHYLHQLKRF
ncbi:MAG: tRNA (cytidine(34)-2'-O)-methyltransferase [Deltaproteobacteria bacterium]|nr:tRNA (cytidine(34)-2'-O)-methyltransferase [Deltaproteobacteria bacterium]MBW1929451.1 tRNA (cytidine(34)-2'-O)-methyltransferase [Deltaproteobacteria bacterium]MBW2023890.1 tRNA (cytidine(34)-2'-O)-methyltransferase [Deltaproteobacteria bacterium]MBW2124179.1 tRNA (cytidine(34)-2'-O)-methyltransferase [Deltaproteobacteria bacterium]RLB24741.1 MAG: tRNA (uridine(34)/cytosine(34)/5-carboxymethylaminomethyluridine(34)-2'-O)-methyltransferase TrmL [Deltaproteobacteria bacterium]